jgi:SAM-dependent methyltransferase
VRQRNRQEWDRRGVDLHERIEHEQLHYDEWAQRQAIEIPRFPLTVKIHENAKRTFPYPTEKWGFLPQVGRILEGLDWHEKRVLQLGGSGMNAVKFAIAGSFPVLLIDPSLETLKLALNRVEAYEVESSVCVIQAIAEEMPFPDNFFDIVFAGNVLHHTLLEKSAREIYRVLKPGGTLCFIEPFEGSSLFKFFRIILPYPGKEKRTSRYEYPLTWKDLRLLTNTFDGNDYLYFGVFMAITEYLVRLVGKPRSGYILIKMLQGIDYAIIKRFRFLRRFCLRVGGKLSKKRD